MISTADKELLDLAATAAGLNPGQPAGWKWNPLKDDGDAFRLAIKTGLCIIILDGQMCVGRWHSESQGLNGASLKVAGLAQTERVAAFRRAIVLAAAEIGKKEGAQ